MNSNQNESQLIYWGSLQLLNKKVFNIFNLFASHLGKLERMLRFLFLVQYSLHWYWWCSYHQRIGETWSETLRRNHMNSRSSTDSSGLVEFQFVVKDVKFLCCYLRNKSRYILYSLLVNWRLSYVCATHSMFHKILETDFTSLLQQSQLQLPSHWLLPVWMSFPTQSPDRHSLDLVQAPQSPHSPQTVPSTHFSRQKIDKNSSFTKDINSYDENINDWRTLKWRHFPDGHSWITKKGD